MTALFDVTTGTVALTAATAKIPIEIAPSSLKSIEIIELDITFDQVFATTVPLVELCTYGTVGSGGTAPTPNKMGVHQQDAAQAVIRINDSTAPTTIVSVLPWYYSQDKFLWPLGRERVMLASTKWCIRVTSPVTANCAINFSWAE